MLKLILFFLILFFNGQIIFAAAVNTETKDLISKLDKKVKDIKTFYAELVTTGYDQDNKMTPVNIQYWKDRDKIKKIISDGSETVTTLILGDSFTVFYSTSGILLYNNIKNLDDTEILQFKMQNYFLEFYKLKEIIKRYDIVDFIKETKTRELSLISKSNRKEKINLVFNTSDLQLVKITISIKNEINSGYNEFVTLFKKIKINQTLPAEIFSHGNIPAVKRQVIDSDYY